MGRTVTEWLRQHALEAAGVFDRFDYEKSWRRNWNRTFQEILETWGVDLDFMLCMRRRLVMGEMRYGRDLAICDAPHPPTRTFTAYVAKCLRKVNGGAGNHEMYIDLANYALLTWAFGGGELYECAARAAAYARLFDPAKCHPEDRNE